jgi:hypothetical protein
MESVTSPYVSRGYRAFILGAGAYDMIIGLSSFLLYPVLYVLMSALDPGLPMTPQGSVEMMHLKMNGVFMFFAGFGYVFPYLNYEKFKFYIPVFGIGLRTWGGGFLLYTSLFWGTPLTYGILGAVDLAIALGFVLFLLNYRRKRIHIRNY